MLTKARAPRVVSLRRGEGADEVNGRPCDVYADHLEQVQWARIPTEGGAEQGPLAPPGVQIELGEITEGELGEALRSTRAGKCPGPT